MLRQGIIGMAIVLLAGLGACAPQSAQEPGTLRFAYEKEPFPPFHARDAAGNWTGFEVDLMNAVCAEMNIKCVIVPTPWDALISDLRAKKFDIIWTSMTVTEARDQVIDFSDIYYNTPSVLIAPRASEIDPDRPQSLNGKRIAAYPPQQAFAKQSFGGAEIIPVDPGSETTLDSELAVQHADAIFLDRFLADVFLKSERGKAFAVKWTAPWNSHIQAGVAAGIREGDTALKDRINTALKAVRTSGRYRDINARYFDYDVSGS
jgi:polar amino acid transport system substrate-binding protein